MCSRDCARRRRVAGKWSGWVGMRLPVYWAGPAGTVISPGSGWSTALRLWPNLWRPQLRGAHDEMMLKAARAGGGDRRAFNRRDYGDAPARFGLLLLPPAEAYRRIEL